MAFFWSKYLGDKTNDSIDGAICIKNKFNKYIKILEIES